MVAKGTYLRLILAVSFFCCSSNSFAASLWKDNVANTSARPTALSENTEKARALTLDYTAMANLLLPSAGSEQARKQNTITIEAPLPDGSNILLELEQTQLLPEALRQAYPTISTYQLTEPQGFIVSGVVDFTDHGFHALLQTYDGQTLVIDPTTQGDLSQYISYQKSDLNNTEPHQCGTDEHHHSPFAALQSRPSFSARSTAKSLVEYRIAIAATAEYTQAQGGSVSDALSAIATTLSRVNEIYEDSLGVRFTLVENNDLLIYTNASEDPYTNYQIDDLLNENQTNIDRVIGTENYDIGHVFGTSGGGLAYISSLCNDSVKAKGASGISRPYGDFFIVDFVAHELGHQLGATHTFNANQGICTSGARTASSAFEPGSGSTIMSYAGGCGTDDVQSYADALFHSGNIQQVTQNIAFGSAASCGTEVIHGNSAPTVFAGNSHTIPANTPFELSAIANDSDGDILRYSWDQKDVGDSSAIDFDTGNNPLFRVLPLTTSATRSFPALNTLLGGTEIAGETLPSTDRAMTMQVSAYDGYNAPTMDSVELTVVNTGEAFALDNQANAYQIGGTTELFWNTADTQFAPISCTHVDIYLSVNNGISFNHPLVLSTTNDGSVNVTIPSNISSTAYGRFKISCGDNIFFDVSNEAFSLTTDASVIVTNTRSSNADTTTLQASDSGGGSTSPMYFFATLLIYLYRKHKLAE
ncbi:hypothetical protein EOL70_06290 [Leucothrix sargassi]|nr:hypothetical protein EOL70_06290 [Leucothrix sargassi]